MSQGSTSAKVVHELVQTLDKDAVEVLAAGMRHGLRQDQLSDPGHISEARLV